LIVVFVVVPCIIIDGVITELPRPERLCAWEFGAIAANIERLINQPNQGWEKKKIMLHLESVDWQGSGREPSFESDRFRPKKSIDDDEFKARLSVPQIVVSLTPCR
jgi:hypothetical protein